MIVYNATSLSSLLRLGPSLDRDVLLVGSQTNLLAYDMRREESAHNHSEGRRGGAPKEEKGG